MVALWLSKWQNNIKIRESNVIARVRFHYQNYVTLYAKFEIMFMHAVRLVMNCLGWDWTYDALWRFPSYIKIILDALLLQKLQNDINSWVISHFQNYDISCSKPMFMEL